MELNETEMEKAFKIYFRKNPCKGTNKEKDMFKYAYKCGMNHLYHTLGMKLDLMFNEEYFKTTEIIRNTWRLTDE